MNSSSKKVALQAFQCKTKVDRIRTLGSPGWVGGGGGGVHDISSR